MALWLDDSVALWLVGLMTVWLDDFRCKNELKRWPGDKTQECRLCDRGPPGIRGSAGRHDVYSGYYHCLQVGCIESTYYIHIIFISSH